MTLPTIHGASYHEYELAGCPLLSVAGLECVALDRVARMLGVDRKEAARRLAAFGPVLPWDIEGKAPALDHAAPLFEKEPQ